MATAGESNMGTKPPPPSASDRGSASSYRVKSRCACGKVRVVAQASPLRLDCHCPACRKFHDSAFVCYLPVESYEIVQGETSAYRDVCHGLVAKEAQDSAAGAPVVDRISCKSCFSKLLTTLSIHTNNPTDTSTTAPSTKSFLNMGPLVDSSLPKQLLALEPVSVGGSPVGWSRARPDSQESEEDDEDETLTVAVGHCACSRTRYRTLLQETELQHCYCRLCRQYSGGPFMTWFPAHCFEWIDSDGQPSREDPPPLVRTTLHGRRHFCRHCRSCLTIVYDDQPDTIWPVAASLDDATPLSLYSVSHICCRYRPKWYRLPQDGLPRIQEAS